MDKKKKKKKSPKVAIEEKKDDDVEHKKDVSNDSDGSFEDLELEAAELKQSEAKPVDEDAPKVKLFMKDHSQLIDDDYLRKDKSSVCADSPTDVNDMDDEVNWFAMYSQKQFEFRKDADLLNKIRHELRFKRTLGMKL